MGCWDPVGSVRLVLPKTGTGATGGRGEQCILVEPLPLEEPIRRRPVYPCPDVRGLHLRDSATSQSRPGARHQRASPPPRSFPTECGPCLTRNTSKDSIFSDVFPRGQGNLQPLQHELSLVLDELLDDPAPLELHGLGDGGGKVDVPLLALLPFDRKISPKNRRVCVAVRLVAANIRFVPSTGGKAEKRLQLFQERVLHGVGPLKSRRFPLLDVRFLPARQDGAQLL